VKAGDTLSGIAGQIGHEGVSLDQALIAIYQANPAAFFGSVHQLKAGSTLSVPDRQAMAAIDPAKAREQIRVQTRDFNEYRSRLAESARSVAAAKSGQSVAGSVTAKVEDKGAPAPSGDQLRLSKSGAAAAGEGAGATGTAATKSGDAAEQRVARDAALRESESRVTELEKNVGDLQRLLELKNRQLADLQKQVDAAKALDTTATGTIAKADAVPTTPQAPAAAPEPAPVAAPAQAPTAQAPAAATPAEAAKPELAPAAAPAQTPTEAPKPAQAAPKPAPASEPSFVEDLMSNPLMLPGLGAILALGAGYGWYAMRRRRKVEKFEDSLIAAEGFSTNSLFGSTGGQNVDTTSSVFSSSTKDSGVDVHSTEVDPIAEAEVYIAYGREAQAEEILKEALRRQPERQAIRAKLLEIYSGRKDLDAFNRVAGEMHRATGGQNEEWAKVVTMGLALDPDNPMYTGLAPAESAAEAQPAGDAERSAAADAVGTEAAASPESDQQKAEDAVDFGVLEGTAVSFAETRPLAEDEPKRDARAEEDVPSLDFDLDLDTTIGKAGEMLAGAREKDGDEDSSELERAVEGKFDLPSLDLTQTGPNVDEPSAEASEQELEDLNIDLPALEGLSKTFAPRAGGGNVQAQADQYETDLASIGLDLEPAPATPSQDGIKWQEMATKLDLASAYEEIGDKEGARELLEEVVKGGDGDQQQKARSMLTKLA
jgi:pilus assembly protein FimV